MKIDAHQHFWQLDRGDYGWLTPDLTTLYRDFLPADLDHMRRDAGVDGTILVQAAPTVAETRFMLGLADQTDWILGVVGWVDFESDAAPDMIAELAEHPKLVGLRPMVQDLPDDDWLLKPELDPALTAMVSHNLTFDALVFPRHLGRLHALMQRRPDLRIVLNHCAKPEIRTGSWDDWAKGISDVAARGDVFCKLSGIVTEASEDWSVDDLTPYVRHIAQTFGPERIMFGSDWPVLELASDYATWSAIVAQFTSDVPGIPAFPQMAKNCLSAYPRASRPPAR